MEETFNTGPEVVQTDIKLALVQPTESSGVSGTDTSRTLQRYLESMKCQLREIALAAEPLTNIRDEIEEKVEKTHDLLREILLRVEQHRVSVLVTGTMNAGKSSLINALLGAMLCPIGDQATTAGMLTIERSSSDHFELLLEPSDSQQDALELSEQRTILKTKSAAVVSSKLRELNAAARGGDNQAPDAEYELRLRVPELVMAHSSNTALEIVDSPGSNEALSPHLNEKWAVAIAHSDIVIVVVAYSQLETKDVAAFWARYARELPSQASSRNLLVFVNKYDQADSSHAFTEEDEEIDHIRRRCVQCVEDATEGKVNLLVDQVFIGSARDALLSQIATGINDENPNEDFQQEYSEVSALASRVFGRRREPPPASAGALKDLVNWCDVRNDSRIDAFVSCFGAKARSAEVTHVYKLIAAVDAAVLEIRSAYTSRGGYFQQEITKRGAEEKELCLMEKKVEDYFTSDIEPEDTVAEDESRRLLAEWISETNDAIMDALDSQSSQVPLSLSVTDEELLIHTLERFEQSAREAVRLSAESYKPSIAGMTEARWLGVRACDDDVQRLIAGIRGSLSEEVVGSSHAVRVPTIDATLEQLSDWMLYAVRVDVEDATAQLMLTARTESDPGAVYRSEIDFARPVNRRRLHGDFYHDSDSGHIKLGPAANPFTATFQVDERFESHPFVLELSHLASDGGPSSRAPVTVLLNDHVIRENFCPRAENGSENDHIGLWDYAFNSWHLDPLIVQRGENRVQIRYCEGGTTFYWLRSICLHCEVPPTSTTVIDTRTIKDFVQTSILSRLQEGLDSGDGVLTRAQHELSSPRSVLQAIRSHYNRVFVALKEVKVQDQVKFEYQQRAVATVLSYCEELASSCQTLANEVGTATPPAEA